MFKKMKERLEEGGDPERRECSVCDRAEPGHEIESYYGKDYCPEHLEARRGEVRRARAGSKEQPEASAGELGDRLAEKIEETVGRIREELRGEVSATLEPLIESVRELVESEKVSRTSVMTFSLDKASILRIVFNGRHTLLSRLTGLFGMASRDRIKDLLDEMSKEYRAMDSEGEYRGRLLWKNGHGWYTLNPNLPRRSFERITGATLSEGDWYSQLDLIVDRATKGDSEDQLFKEWGEGGGWELREVHPEVLEGIRAHRG
jgi:hypothetical protein